MVLKKRAAMELSMSTVVILVLAMMMLIMGIVLVKNIFGTATGAISDVDKGVKDKIAQMFAEPDKKLVIYPTARKIEITQRTQGEGFAFSVRNIGLESIKYSYRVEADSNFEIKKKCAGLTKKDADGWIDLNSGSFTLKGSSVMENPKLVSYTIPDNAPACTIPYNINVCAGTSDCSEGSASLYVSDSIYLTVVPR